MCTCAPQAYGLDKQGSAHGGQIGPEDRSPNISGSLMFGLSPYNPSYAARPDNTGKALLRYGAHFDFDVLGRLLSFPVDANFFTDAEQGDIRILAPTEFDIIEGITLTFALGPGALELGSRVEHDRPVDIGNYTQTYVDARGRYLYSLAQSLASRRPGAAWRRHLWVDYLRRIHRESHVRCAPGQYGTGSAALRRSR